MFPFFSTLFLCSLTASISAGARYEGVELVSKQQFMYGKFHAKIKVAHGSGLINAMFLFHDESYKDHVYWREIDWEVLGRSTAAPYLDIHYGYGNDIPDDENEKRWIMHIQQNAHRFLDHDYYWFTIEWTPSRITRYIHTSDWKQNVAYHTMRVEHVNVGGHYNDVSRWNEGAMTLRFNFWAFNNVGWSGVVDESRLGKARMMIDEVIYYRFLGEDHDGHGIFQEEWHDHMENDGRWRKDGFHVIGDTTLRSHHVSFSSSNAVLCIHKA